MELQKRKSVRLRGYDYNTPGVYFITICTKDKKKLLSKILVGTGVSDGPQNILTEYGRIADEQIKFMDGFYDNLSVDKYVIMPNHIHLLLRVSNGPSGMPVPTNSAVAKFVGTFKRFCNKKYGQNIWQLRSYDRIVRGESDYNEIWTYIDNNLLKWELDKLYLK